MVLFRAAGLETGERSGNLNLLGRPEGFDPKSIFMLRGGAAGPEKVVTIKSKEKSANHTFNDAVRAATLEAPPAHLAYKKYNAARPIRTTKLQPVMMSRL